MDCCFFRVFFSGASSCSLLFSGVGLSVSPLPAILAAAGTGTLISLLLQLISRISRRAAWVFGLLLAVPAALLFTIESMIRTVFTTYMTPSNLVVGAGSVIRNYGDEFRRAFFAGAGRFVLFLLPLIVCLLLRMRFTKCGMVSADTSYSGDIPGAASSDPRKTDTADAADSADAEGSSDTPVSSEIAGNNHYFTMGNQLQRLGYSSIAFHAGSLTYYKRNTTHENLGYNQFLANENGMKKFLGLAYAPDTTLIDRTMGLYLDHQPFSVYYMTISGHAPYQKNSSFVRKYYDQVNEIVGNEYQEKTKYYICYQMELEAAMKLLVERLEEAGIADDTVIALTGDHYPYGLGGGRTWQNDKDYIKDLLHGSDFFRWEQDRSGLIIWSGCLEHDLADMACTVTEPVGNLDILPTLSNLFGLEYDSRLLPGRDVFAPGVRPLVWWNNLSFVTTEGKYDGRKGEWHPNEGYEQTADDPEFLEQLHSLVNDRMLMARLIMQTDYYRLLFGEDDVAAAGDILWDPEMAGKAGWPELYSKSVPENGV